MKTYNVSRETMEKLKHYEALVKEWNNKFNLVSKSSVSDIWTRHILDSVQLVQFIKPADKVLYDFGSGAGFPAIVLAIMAEQLFSELKINLVESIGKKATFLNVVKTELKLDNVTVCHNRIENLKISDVDIISSRALASLSKLLEYSYPFCNSKTNLIFPKGENWEVEVKEAKQQWLFDCNVVQSITNTSGHILSISNIRRKKW
ncbi:MAG: 16S rRNA (guanine(527)-N(7))-methyltransferase RsmG [Acetobacter sp.]|nr:16S rRNA (guanine(527)-N(7))-methyltransferase RsmG [Acetobacter sp.]